MSPTATAAAPIVPIPLRPETQSSPPQATVTHLPPALLPALAKRENATPDALATLTAPGCSTLYNAVTEYVALSGFVAPLFADGINNSECTPPSSDDDFSDDDDYYRSRRRRSRTMDGKKKPDGYRIVTPFFCMGLGVTTVSWPPPDEYSATRMAEENGAIPFRTLEDEREDQTACELQVAHYAVGEPVPVQGSSEPVPMREIVLVSSKGAKLLRQFATEICQWMNDRTGKVPERPNRFSLKRFRTGRGTGHWVSDGMKRARPKESVILPEGMMEDVLDDVRRFLAPETKKWYARYGLPQKRSFLFYGAPGTGKTSTIRVLASEFGLTCCFLSMTDAHFSNQMLGDALSQLPRKPLIVLEDVDALFNEDRKNEQGGSLTFSGLLNALDGLISAEGGVITVMTTNHVDRLDSALIRGGRVDRRFLFGKPDRKEIGALFSSFYPKAEYDIVERFVKAVIERQEVEALNISTLQELFIKMREKTAEECADGVHRFFETHIPKEEKKGGEKWGFVERKTRSIQSESEDDYD